MLSIIIANTISIQQSYVIWKIFLFSRCLISFKFSSYSWSSYILDCIRFTTQFHHLKFYFARHSIIKINKILNSRNRILRKSIVEYLFIHWIWNRRTQRERERERRKFDCIVFFRKIVLFLLLKKINHHQFYENLSACPRSYTWGY